MNNRTTEYEIRLETKRLVSSHSLKRCTLCGAVNAIANEECFVCRWRGAFDTNPAALEVGVNQLLHRCPELATAMADHLGAPKTRGASMRAVLARFFARLRRR